MRNKLLVTPLALGILTGTPAFANEQIDPANVNIYSTMFMVQLDCQIRGGQIKASPFKEGLMICVNMTPNSKKYDSVFFSYAPNGDGSFWSRHQYYAIPHGNKAPIKSNPRERVLAMIGQE